MSQVKRENKNPQAADYSPSKAAPSDNLSKEIASRQAIKSCLDKTTASAGVSLSLTIGTPYFFLQVHRKSCTRDKGESTHTKKT